MIKLIPTLFIALGISASGVTLGGDPMRPPQFAPAQEKKAPIRNSFALQQITVSKQQTSAVINGQLVKEGDSISGARVLRITSDKVVLKYGQKLKTLSLLSNTKHSEK